MIKEKKLNFVSILRAECSDIDQIKPLMNNIFGPFPEIEKIFSKWISQDQQDVFVARVDDKVIGVSTWGLKEGSDFSKYESFGNQAIDFIKSHKIAWVYNLVVLPEYRYKKIGQKLCLSHAEWLKKQNCTAVLGTSWVHGTEDHSQHLYIKAGFKKLGESREFLRHQLQGGAVCAVCKTSECHCNSILFGITTSDLLKSFAIYNKSRSSPSLEL